jgi:hypothetical protein
MPSLSFWLLYSVVLIKETVIPGEVQVLVTLLRTNVSMVLG